MTIRFLTPAREELLRAIDLYEREAPGLGAEFLDDLDHALETIPFWWSQWRTRGGGRATGKTGCGRGEGPKASLGVPAWREIGRAGMAANGPNVR